MPNKGWFAEWGKAALTLAIAAVGYAAQWGAVNAKLDQMIAEVRSMKVVELDLAQRVSHLEGQTQGRDGNAVHSHQPGGRGDSDAERSKLGSADRGTPAS